MPCSVTYEADLSAFLSDWKLLLVSWPPAKGERSPEQHWPQPFFAYLRHENSLGLLLEKLDGCLQVLEREPILSQPPRTVYSDAITYLDAVYFFTRMLCDTVAGLIRHYYRQHEKVDLPPSFSRQLKTAQKGELPNGLNEVICPCQDWFPQLKDRRDDTVHRYETVFIGWKTDGDRRSVVHRFSRRNDLDEAQGIREFIGQALAGFQGLIDRLLPHLESEFSRWHRLTRHGKPPRRFTLSGRRAYRLWWAV